MNSKNSVIDKSVAQKLAACLILSVLLLAGCAGQVTQSTEMPKPEVRSLRNVSMKMSPQAALKIANDVEFDIGAFEEVLLESLKSRQLMASDGDFDLNVVIKEVRVRGTASAVLFGFLAGDDHVTGEATVLDRNGEAIYTYDVKASYALGGFGGGDDATRVNWLYKKFSEVLSDELVRKRNSNE